MRDVSSQTGAMGWRWTVRRVSLITLDSFFSSMALFYARPPDCKRAPKHFFADETEVTFTDDWLLKLLLAEKRISYSGGIYRYTQIAFAYHSCAIDGGELTYEQVESLYDTYTVPTHSAATSFRSATL